MRYCIFCGVSIPPDAQFCQICGKKQPDNTKSADQEPIKKEKDRLESILDSPKKMAIAGIGVFVLVLIIITAIMFAVLK